MRAEQHISARRSSRIIGPIFALMLALAAQSTVHAQAIGRDIGNCDPSRQSCAPATPSAGSAQCGPSPGGATCETGGPANLPGGTGISVGAGNPINLINGNKYQREVDLAPLPGVLGLEIVRHYNSHYSSPTTPTGIMGRGWRLSYETELHVTGRTVQIIQADGKRLIFNRDAQDPSLCASDDPAHGRIRIEKTRRGDEYAWTWPDGRRLDFNHQGKLVQILAASGEFVAMQHDHKGKLLKVTDPQGRSLHLKYLDPALGRNNDRFKGVVAIGSPVGEFRYDYGGDAPKGRPLDKIHLLANLVKVDIPAHYDSSKRHPDTGRDTTTGSISRLYHYQDPTHPTLLTGISISISNGKQAQRLVTWAYNADGRAVMSVKGEPLRHDSDGRPASGTGIEQVTLDRSDPGQTKLTNSLGQVTTYKHAIIGGEYRLLEIRGPGCASCGDTDVRYGYDKLGRVTQTSTLDDNGQPLETAKTDLDAYGRKIAVSRIRYSNGKPGKSELVARYAYAPHAADAQPAPQPTLIARPSVVAGREHRIRITYNAAQQPLQIEESGWSPSVDGGQATEILRTTRFGYAEINGRSILARVDGPLKNGPTASPADADVTAISTDPTGSYPVEILAPGKRLIRIATRDEAGRPRTILAPGGIEMAYDLDPAGRIIKFSKSGLSEHFSYNALGQLAEVIQASGQRMRFTYSADGRLSKVFDTQNNQIRIERDTEGRLQARSLHNPDGSIAQQQDLGRYVMDQEAPAGPIPATAKRDELIDPQGNSTRIMRAADGLPDAIVEPGRLATSLAYDRQRKLIELTDPRNIRTDYLHDDFGRLVRVASQDGGVTVFSWDAADHLLAKTTAYGSTEASTTHYRYDAAGRVTEQQTAEGRTRIAYGPHGRPLRMVFPGGEERYGYDRAARLTAHTRIIDGHAFTTRYAYDDRGQLRQKTLPDGQVLDYRYNGTLHSKPGLLSAILRKDLFGQTVLLRGLNDAEDGYANQRYQLANGIDYARQLDRNGGITRIGSPGIWEENHQRDAAGHLAQRTPLSPAGARGYSYRYDALGRLTGMARAGLLKTATNTDERQYRYDDGGNLLTQMTGIGATKYAVDSSSNRILAAYAKGEVQTYAYNGAGSITRIGNTEYAWNSQQQLIKISRNGKPVAEYGYNPFGERIKKVVYSGNQKKVAYFFYDGSQLTAEAKVNQGAARITKQYVWLQDQGGARPIAMLAAKESRFGEALTMVSTAAGSASSTDVHAVVADHTGAPRTIVGNEKKIIWQAEVIGYGQAAVNDTNGLRFNLRGSNQYFDEESGLHYNTRRYLDPSSGRYMSADPSGQAGGINLYAFANNNPVANIDPLGLQAKPAGAVSGWTFDDKLKYVIDSVAVRFPGELGDALRELVSPAALSTTAAIFGIWAGAQFTPYGWAADVALAGIGYLFLGKAVWDVIKGVYDSSSLILNARCEKDLDDAGGILAKGLSSAVAASTGSAVISGGAKIARLVRQIFRAGIPSAQKSATTAAISESWFGKFEPGRTRSGSIENQEFLGRRGGNGYAPWDAKRSVIDAWLNPGKKIYMVIERNQTPGAWATPHQFNSLSEARDRLSILNEFKTPGKDYVLQEYIVKAPIPIREGYAGSVSSRTNPSERYDGGGLQ